MENEIDVSENVNRVLKYGFVSLLSAALVVAGAAALWRMNHAELTAANAEVKGRFVLARARAAGTVLEILRENGDSVRQGDIVARVKVKISDVDIQNLEANLELTRRNLSELEAGTSVVRAVSGGESNSYSVSSAAMNYEKMQKLFEMGAVSARERDEAEAAYQTAVSGSSGEVSYQTITRPASPKAIEAAQTAVRQAEAALAAARAESGATEITAPVDGTVFLTEIKSGDAIHPGQPILSIGDADGMWLEAYVSPEYRDRISPGQFASYEIDGREFHGAVLEIEEDSEQNSKTHKDRLILKISIPQDKKQDLRPGIKTSAKISIT